MPNGYIHSNTVFLQFLHCCGKIDEIVPDVIELGFDVLHPIQPECMSFEDTYRQYGEEERGSEWIHIGEAILQWWSLRPFRLGVTDRIDVTPRDLATPEEDLRTQIQHNNLFVRPSIYFDISW